MPRQNPDFFPTFSGKFPIKSLLTSDCQYDKLSMLAQPGLSALPFTGQGFFHALAARYKYTSCQAWRVFLSGLFCAARQEETYMNTYQLTEHLLTLDEVEYPLTANTYQSLRNGIMLWSSIFVTFMAKKYR